MEKIIKKTVASAMALALIGGGSASVGGAGLFAPALTANAERNDGFIDVDYASVALDDSITLRFYVKRIVNENADNDTYDEVTISGPNGRKVFTEPSETTESEHNYDSNGNLDIANGSYVYFVYDIYEYPVYANQLDKKVSISFKKEDTTVKVKVGNKITSRYSYSVNDYCNSIINDATGTYDGYTVNAACSLKNLGLATDNYFNNGSKTIDWLGSEYDLEDYAPGSGDDVKYSLVLDSKLAARVYVPDLPADAVADDLDTVLGKNGKYCFEKKGFAPTELDDFYYVFYNDYDFDFCPLSYCYRAIQSEDAKTVDMAKGIYEYFKYVCNYANSLY